MATVPNSTLDILKERMTAHITANVEEMKRAYNLVVNMNLPLPAHGVAELVTANARADAASMMLGYVNRPDTAEMIEDLVKYAIVTASNSNQPKETLVVLLEAQQILDFGY